MYVLFSLYFICSRTIQRRINLIPRAIFFNFSRIHNDPQHFSNDSKRFSVFFLNFSLLDRNKFSPQPDPTIGGRRNREKGKLTNGESPRPEKSFSTSRESEREKEWDRYIPRCPGLMITRSPRRALSPGLISINYKRDKKKNLGYRISIGGLNHVSRPTSRNAIFPSCESCRWLNSIIASFSLTPRVGNQTSKKANQPRDAEERREWVEATTKFVSKFSNGRRSIEIHIVVREEAF